MLFGSRFISWWCGFKMTTTIITEAEYNSFVLQQGVREAIKKGSYVDLLNELKKEKTIIQTKVVSNTEKGKELLETTTKVPYTSYLGSMVQIAKLRLRKRESEQQLRTIANNLYFVFSGLLFLISIMIDPIIIPTSHGCGARFLIAFVASVTAGIPPFMAEALLEDERNTLKFREQALLMLETLYQEKNLL